MTTYYNIYDLSEWPSRRLIAELSHDPQIILNAHRLVDLVEEPITVTNIQEVERIARGISNDMITRL